MVSLPASAAREDYLGRRVGTIQFTADGEIREAELRQALKIEPGQPLELNDVARSIRLLYADGIFRNIRVEAELAPDGSVNLTYVLSLHFRIESIAIEGAPAGEKSLEQLAPIRVGGLASLDAIDHGAEEMRDQLLRRGYMEAIVDPAVNFERQTHTAIVTYFVEAGARARVRAIRFVGQKEPFTDAELGESFKRKIGREYAVANARGWGEKLTDLLVRRDYRDASVRFEEAVYDADSKAVDLVYDVEIGPRMVVDLEGSDERGVRRPIPFKKKEPYSDDKLQETLEAIEEWYQKRGYFFASARSDEETRDGIRTLTITVRPGDPYELGDVVFSGREEMPDDEIDSVIGAGHPNIFQRLIAGVSGAQLGVTITQLEEDRQAIESLYRTNGYLEAIVDRGRAEPREDGNTIDIVFEIYEGPKTVLSGIEVTGLLAMDRTSLPELESVVGEPANPIKISDDVLAIQSAMSDAGFAEARVDYEIQRNDVGTEARLVFKVDEGERYRYGKTTVRGNTFTDESVVRIKAAALTEGAPYSYKDVSRVQRELYQLGIFKRVAISPVTSVSDPLVRNLEVEIEEGQAVRLTGSVGYSTDEKVRLRGSIAHRNLFGKARYLGLDALYSDVIERYFLTYREPFTFGRDLSTQVTIFQDDEFRDQINLDRHGLFIEVSKLIRENLRYSFRYDYRVVTPDCPGLTEEECKEYFFGIQTDQKDSTIASVSQNIFLDMRDDAISPKSGYLARASIEYAFPAFQSNAEFVKGLTQVSWFLPVGRRGVFGLSGRAGLIVPISQGDDPFNDVPYPERFFAGGENSHRGFRLKKMGLLGVFDAETGAVTPDGATIQPQEDPENPYRYNGGNAMLIFNAEYRYSITESVGMTAFVDVGQIWRLISTVDLSQLRYAPGVGVYYDTPVGPIRFDLAYNIGAERFEDEWLPILTIGYSF